jgi:hypothetical protein
MSVPEPVLGEPLAESAIAVPSAVAPPSSVAPPSIGVPATYPATYERARRAVGLRAWLLTAFLFLVPLIAYWPATFHEYGLRDDYSNLREAHEEPGKIVKFCASHARPIYGWLLQSTYGQTSSVHNLRWMRLFASFLLGALSLVTFRGLRSLGWSFSPSLCVALAVGLVPAAQVIAGWAVGWPYAATALLAFGVFFIADGAFGMGSDSGTGRLVAQWLVALSLMVVSALIYQPSAMFYVVPLAAALIARRDRTWQQSVRWLGAHLIFVVLALGLAYCAMTVLYSSGVFVKSGRVAFEHHWGDKIAWFLGEALPNSLSVLVLNDNNHLDRGLYLGGAGLAGLILIAGAWLEWRRYGRARGLVWLASLLALPVFAFSISLVASERYATYRTVLAMTAVLMCFLVVSIDRLTERWAVANRRLLATLLLGTLFCAAQHHVYALIAVPQGNEWKLIVDGAKQVQLKPNSKPRIFAIASTPADISTATIYHDEFGSLSTNSEWVPTEMFKRAIHDLHPEIANINARYEFTTGPKLPVDRRFDLIIDLRRLRQFHTDN